jgi:hypothetical protein
MSWGGLSPLGGSWAVNVVARLELFRETAVSTGAAWAGVSSTATVVGLALIGDGEVSCTGVSSTGLSRAVMIVEGLELVGSTECSCISSTSGHTRGEDIITGSVGCASFESTAFATCIVDDASCCSDGSSGNTPPFSDRELSGLGRAEDP